MNEDLIKLREMIKIRDRKRVSEIFNLCRTKQKSALYVIPSLKIETDLDRILDSVTYFPTSIELISKKLERSEEYIEDHLKLLERHGLIELHYPVFGKITARRIYNNGGKVEKEQVERV